MIRQLLLFYGILVIAAMQQSLAQAPLRPIRSHPDQIEQEADLINQIKSSLPGHKAGPDTLSLPFFDDFSNSKTLPDSNLWQRYSGAYINNRYPTNPPSLNVATLDGANSQGIPYGLGLGAVRTRGDSLRSKPINLSGLSVANNVYFSFFYQAGTGFAQNDPDPGDSLVVRFLRSNGSWTTVWSIGNADFDSSFTFIDLLLDQPDYFHAGFQFEFYVIGNNSAQNFDIFNIDYIELDANRFQGDSLNDDFAFVETEKSLLQPWTAMPFDHFSLNPSAYLQDSVTAFEQVLTTLVSGVASLLHEFTLFAKRDSAVQLLAFTDPTILINSTSIEEINDTVAVDSAVNISEPSDLILQYNISPSTNFDLRQGNDTIELKTRVDDYYSYSDNTAELAREIRDRYFAVPVQMAIGDTLFGLYAYLPPGNENKRGEEFRWAIWNGVSNPNGYVEPGPNPIYTALDSVTSYSIGQWRYMPIGGNGIEITTSDTFFIGLERRFTNLFIGCDISTPVHVDYFTFNNSNSRWIRFIEANTCTPMMRYAVSQPRLGEDTLPFEEEPISVLPLDPKPNKLRVFPNPAQDQITIEWDQSIHSGELIVYNQIGKVLSRFSIGEANHLRLETSTLESGLYVVKLLSHDGKQYTTKYIIAH